MILLRRCPALLLLVVLALTSSLPLSADDVPLGTEFAIAASPADDEKRPVTLHMDGTRFVVVWHQDAAGGAAPDVRGRMVFETGDASSSDFAVSAETLGAQAYPDLAPDGAGGFLVVWQSDGSGDDDIRGRRFDSAGAALATEFVVNTVTAGDQTRPRIARGTAGGFLVTWNSDAAGQDIMARILDSVGTPLATDFFVPAATTDAQLEPDVAAVGTDFVVVWQRDNMGQLDIEARRVSSAGAPVGADLAVNGGDGYEQSYPSVAGSGSHFLVAWQSDTGGTPQIMFRGFDSAGTAVGSETPILSSPGSPQTHSDLAFTDDGNFVVTWRQEVLAPRKRGSSLLIRTRQVAGPPFSALRTTGPARRGSGALTLSSANGFYPRVAAGGSGFLVVWQGTDTAMVPTAEVRGRFVGDDADLVFTDGFESGNTSMWSLTSP